MMSPEILVGTLNPNEIYYEHTPLTALVHERSMAVDIMKLLLEDPRVNVNKRNPRGDSALDIACVEDKWELAEVLLHHPVHFQSIDIYQMPFSYKTPLFEACERGHKEMVSLLMEFQNLDLKTWSPTFEDVHSLFSGRINKKEPDSIECLIATGEFLIPNDSRQPNAFKFKGAGAYKDPEKKEMAKVVERYKKDPRASICEMRFKLNIPQRWAGQLFVITTQYGNFKPGCPKDVKTFMKITRQLPLEIKMLVVNLACGINDQPFIKQETIARGDFLLKKREALKAAKNPNSVIE